MKFTDAIELLKEGKKVRRKRWIESYLIEKPAYGLRVKTPLSDCGINLEDVEATDWEEYVEEDNWSYCDYDSSALGFGIKKLKNKILKDIKKEIESMNYLMCDKFAVFQPIEQIIHKRFGF